MTESTELLLFNAKTTKHKKKKKKNSTFDRRNNTAALIGINLYSVLFDIYSFNLLNALLNMPIVPENKALFDLFLY